MPRTTADWVTHWRDNRYWWGSEELAREHNALHAEFGSSPNNEAIVEVEQEMSAQLRSSGLEHRHDDALAKKAGTIVKNPIGPTVGEVEAYLNDITLDGRAVELIQDVDGGPIYVSTRGSILAGMEAKLLKAINRHMPPGLKVKQLSKNASGSFARTTTIYRLSLGREWNPPVVTTWDVVVAHLRTAAANASSIFKADQDPSISFTIVKQKEEDEPERIVTGAVLVPNELDKTVKNMDGSDTGAEGDIYDEVEIQKGMFWWMENADMTFAYHHVAMGGMMLMKEDVKILENFQARTDYKEGDQDIKAGTWMMTVRVLHDDLWDAILKGDIKSWSIGAHAMGQLVEIEQAA